MEYTKEYVDRQTMQYPGILYKYRDWDDLNHRKILQENTVYFASPKDFEDTYDCNVPESFPNKKELYEMLIQRSKTDNLCNTRQQHRKYARYWSKHSPLANPKVLKEELEYNKLLFNNRFGVLSLTENPTNDVLWENYGNSNKGFCVGFDPQKLLNIAGGGAEVLYSEELPVIDFAHDDYDQKLIKNICYKENKWEYEQEYRLFKCWTNDVSSMERNIKLPENCIIRVIIGKEMSEKNKEEIQRYVSSDLLFFQKN